MEELKEITKAENKVNEILTNREKQIKNLEDQIKNDEAEISEALTAIDKATIEGNLSEYQEAKKILNNAKDAKELHEKMLDRFKTKPLIGKEEYDRTVKAICAEAKALEDQAREKLANLADEAHDISEALRSVMHHANKVLSDLQGQVYRDADRMRGGKDGNKIIYSVGETKQIDLVSTIRWGDLGKNHSLYNEYRMKR